jgi:RNA polymerase sigma-70 factor (ECF subfamily)
MTPGSRPNVVTAAASGDDEALTLNACLRMLRPLLRERHSLGEPVDGIEEVVSPLLDPQQALERSDLVRSVHAAIAALPRPYREVVVMRDLEGLSGEETCESLGLEPAAMKTRLHRARQQIRELLEQSNRIAEKETN